MSRPLRRAVVVLAVVMQVLDSLSRATNEGSSSVMSAVITTTISITIAVFAWRPPIATAILIVTNVVAAVLGATDSVLGGAFLIGLVAFTCSALLTTVYTTIWVAWLATATSNPDAGFEPVGGLLMGTVGVVSLLIGLTVREQHERATKLAVQLEHTEREIAEQLRHERDLIADELHDIVAHEITIVALHAAVLERTDDKQTRTDSQKAIREAAVQALTDIRRVLGMVRGEEKLAPERIPSPDGLDDTIADVSKSLGQAGIRVLVDVPEGVQLPSAPLVALTRVIRESSTNVLKHATGARNVGIRLTIERGWAHLEFSDDSPPSHTAGLPPSGYGIMRLRERFRLFGGSFSAERRPEGWVVSASLPLET
ncbi:MAG: histidine kinase [Microbacterium sp.]